MNALTDFNRKLTAEETQNQYGRATDQFNRESQNAQIDLQKIQSLMSQGMSANNAITNLASSTGRSVADIMQGVGQAQSAAAVGQGQQDANTWNTLAGAPANALSQYYLLNKLMGGEGLGALGGGGENGGITSLFDGAKSLFGGGSTATAGIGAANSGGVGGAMSLQTGAPATVGADAAYANSLAGANALAGGAGAYSATPLGGVSMAGEANVAGLAAAEAGTGVGAGAGGTAAGMAPGMAAGIIGAGIMAAPILGPPLTRFMKNKIAPAFGMGGAPTAPGAGNYINALQGGADQFGGESAAIQRLLAGYDANPNIYTMTPAQHVQQWLAMQRHGQFSAPEGGTQTHKQWLNQVPLSEAQALVDKYRQGMV